MIKTSLYREDASSPTPDKNTYLNSIHLANMKKSFAVLWFLFWIIFDMYSIYVIIKSRNIIINKYCITTKESLFVIVTMHSYMDLLLQKIIYLLCCCKTSLQGHSGFLHWLWYLPICSGGGDDGWETRQPYPGTGLARPLRAHSSWKAFSRVCVVLKWWIEFPWEN